jgi:hypothetical protein
MGSAVKRDKSLQGLARLHQIAPDCTAANSPLRALRKGLQEVSVRRRAFARARARAQTAGRWGSAG